MTKCELHSLEKDLYGILEGIYLIQQKNYSEDYIFHTEDFRLIQFAFRNSMLERKYERLENAQLTRYEAVDMVEMNKYVL